MNKFIYLFLGVILGIAIEMYYMAKREEKIEKTIKYIIKSEVLMKIRCLKCNDIIEFLSVHDKEIANVELAL